MKLFTSLTKTSHIMLMSIGAICFALLAIGLFTIQFVYPFEKILPFTIGITAGCLHSMIKVVLLERSISQTIDMEKERAILWSQLQTAGRYLLTVIVFSAVIMFPKIFGLFGSILGVMSLQLAAHITNFILKSPQ